MYFDQYFIKPAFATLTSLLRTYRHHLAVAFLYIFRVLVSAGLIRPAFSFHLFQSFFRLLSATSAAQLFYPSLSLGVQR